MRPAFSAHTKRLTIRSASFPFLLFVPERAGYGTPGTPASLGLSEAIKVKALTGDSFLLFYLLAARYTACPGHFQGRAARLQSPAGCAILLCKPWG